MEVRRRMVLRAGASKRRGISGRQSSSGGGSGRLLGSVFGPSSCRQLAYRNSSVVISRIGSFHRYLDPRIGDILSILFVVSPTNKNRPNSH